MPDPLIFISHKHSDKAIAEAVGGFVRSEAVRPVRIFLSSSPGFEGVRYGKGISGELRTALANADLFLLIYTSSDEDWSWCMWEWGVANHPASEKTTMIVLQCGPDSPKIDVGTRRVNVRKLDEIQGFVRQYFTDRNVFPSLNGEPLAPFLSKDITDVKAQKLLDDLKKILPEYDPSIEWPMWPFLQLEMPLAQVDRIKSVTKPLSISDQVEIVNETAKILVADPKALSIFGLAGLGADTPFQNLKMVWRTATDSQAAPWFENCCEQIAVAGAEKLPITRPVYVREVSGETEYIPIVTRVRRISYQSVARFDLYFLSLPGADAKLVTSKMLTLEQFYWKPINDKSLEQTLLTTLSEELRSQGKNRLPLLDERKRIRYIIHRASVDDFVLSNFSQAANLTVRDLLGDPQMRTTFETTFATVARNTTLAEARATIRGDIRDIFVTQTGSAEEPVDGWLTNVDVTGGA